MEIDQIKNLAHFVLVHCRGPCRLNEKVSASRIDPSSGVYYTK